MTEEFAKFSISPQILPSIRKDEYLISAPFSEFIDNSLSSYFIHREDFPDEFQLKIEIFCDSESIIIADNAAGITRSDMASKVLGFYDNTFQSNIGLNKHGVGMKQSALWLGDRFTIDSYHLKDNTAIQINFDIHEVIKAYQTTNEVLLPINKGSRTTHGTEIFISNLSNKTTALFPPSKIKSLKIQLTRIYNQLLLANQVHIEVNKEALKGEINNNILESYNNDNYKEISPKKFCIIDPTKEKTKWHITNVFKSKKIYANNKEEEYSLKGEIYILNKNTNIRIDPDENYYDTDSGFKFYKKSKLIFGLTEKINPFGNNDPKSYINLYLGGNFELSENFQKPKIGDKISEFELKIIKELFLKIRNDIETGFYSDQGSNLKNIFSHLQQSKFRINAFNTSIVCGNAHPPKEGPDPRKPTGSSRPESPKPNPGGKPGGTVQVPHISKKIVRKYNQFEFQISFTNNSNTNISIENHEKVVITLSSDKFSDVYSDEFYLEVFTAFIFAYEGDTNRIAEHLNRAFS